MLSGKLLLLILTAWIFAFSASSFAQQQPTTGAHPSAAQVQQLQEQLAKMQTEMDAMQESIQAGNIPPEQLRTMQQHMARMYSYWQQMHIGCCGMYPAGYGCGGLMGRSY